MWGTIFKLLAGAALAGLTIYAGVKIYKKITAQRIAEEVAKKAKEAVYAKIKEKNYSLIVSTHQMILLMFYNKKRSYDIKSLLEMINLSEEKLQLLQTGILVKGLQQPLRAKSVRMLQRKKLCDLPVPIFENRKFLLKEQPELLVSRLEILLTEGKRHEIKRLMEAIDCMAVALKRTSFAGIPLDEALQPGTYRNLTEQEQLLATFICSI